MSQLYDRAEIYDLIESDQRTVTIRRDWKEFLGGREINTMLDVSIGTGGMTLPLQELGIEISGSDLSEAMLARCKMKAAAKGNPVELKCCDFRDLSCWEGREFDCVVSTGNALGYVSNNDILITLEKMNHLVKPGRVAFMVLLAALIVVLYLTFLYRLQIIEGEKYYNQSNEITNSERTVTAARGNILDR